MSGLVLPSGTPLPRSGRAPAPTGADVTLADGQRLRCVAPWSTPPPEAQEGFHYQGPHRLSVIATMDPTPRWGVLLHVSLALPTRDPSWDLVKLVKAAFYGDVDVMMILPQAADYVNIARHAFHLWQTPESWGLR